MAKIVLGLASSHSPQLATRPENWHAMGERAKTVPEHWFAGKTYSYDELLETRSGEHIEKELSDATFQARFNDCQREIARLAQTLNRVAPDVCILFGDDQHEAFNDDIMPSFAIYHGATVDDVDSEGPRGTTDSGILNAPRQRTAHPTDAKLGEYLVEALIERDFDVSRTNQLSPTKHNGAIGHAFYFLYRRLMNNEVIPNVPIMVNTYYPPNAPRASRSYRFGQAVREAVEAWDSNKRVAIMASGGLSHTVIEEDIDRRIVDGLKNDDFTKLTDWPDVRFRGGTSEIKNWIALAGAMSGTGLQPKIEYVPCYRSPAGNGCAMGFGEWV
ncbi:MAG: hypothetical protein EXR58_00295 [Chloroflexi bacterium]|nr:hypothetical protein [Chloroflexota bacterium]